MPAFKEEDTDLILIPMNGAKDRVLCEFKALRPIGYGAVAGSIVSVITGGILGPLAAALIAIRAGQRKNAEKCINEDPFR